MFVRKAKLLSNKGISKIGYIEERNIHVIRTKTELIERHVKLKLFNPIHKVEPINVELFGCTVD